MMNPTNECPFGPKADEALSKFYGSLGSETTEQRITAMETVLGKSRFYGTGGEVPPAAKLACLETEWLAIQGIIELELV